jgi:hypothetical protein
VASIWVHSVSNCHLTPRNDLIEFLSPIGDMEYCSANNTIPSRPFVIATERTLSAQWAAEARRIFLPGVFDVLDVTKRKGSIRQLAGGDDKLILLVPMASVLIYFDYLLLMDRGPTACADTDPVYSPGEYQNSWPCD